MLNIFKCFFCIYGDDCIIFSLLLMWYTTLTDFDQSFIEPSLHPWNKSHLIIVHNLFSVLLKTKIMASGPTTSWEIDGKTVETVSDFIFLGSKITTDGDCSHEIKRHSLEGKL